MPWTGADSAFGDVAEATGYSDLSESDPAELVQKIKEICRNSPESKSQWCAWCDSFHGGTKDPSRIDPEALRGFLSEYQLGTLNYSSGGSVPTPKVSALPPPPPAPASMAGPGKEQPDMAEAVKVGQRTSQSFKAAWVAFCQMKGQKAFDPSRHTKEFLTAYFDYMGDQALATMPSYPPPPSPAPAAKRPRSGDVPASADPSVTSLAERVKQIQRADPMKWQLWAEYCDSECNGTKDPFRHTAASLQTFLTQYEWN